MLKRVEKRNYSLVSLKIITHTNIYTLYSVITCFFITFYMSINWFVFFFYNRIFFIFSCFLEHKYKNVILNVYIKNHTDVNLICDWDFKWKDEFVIIEYLHRQKNKKENLVRTPNINCSYLVYITIILAVSTYTFFCYIVLEGRTKTGDETALVGGRLTQAYFPHYFSPSLVTWPKAMGGRWKFGVR